MELAKAATRWLGFVSAICTIILGYFILHLFIVVVIFIVLVGIFFWYTFLVYSLSGFIHICNAAASVVWPDKFIDDINHANWRILFTFAPSIIGKQRVDRKVDRDLVTSFYLLLSRFPFIFYD